MRVWTGGSSAGTRGGGMAAARTSGSVRYTTSSDGSTGEKPLPPSAFPAEGSLTQRFWPMPAAPSFSSSSRASTSTSPKQIRILYPKLSPGSAPRNRTPGSLAGPRPEADTRQGEPDQRRQARPDGDRGEQRRPAPARRAASPDRPGDDRSHCGRSGLGPGHHEGGG